MSKQIRQYALQPPFVVETHRGAKPVGVRFTQGRVLYVDMEVDPTNLIERRTFTCVGLGQDVPDDATYVDSVTINEQDGSYLLFVYMDAETG